MGVVCIGGGLSGVVMGRLPQRIGKKREIEAVLGTFSGNSPQEARHPEKRRNAFKVCL